MIPDINDALKELLTREIPLRKGEVEVNFDQPKREWSSQLNRPTLNLFLFDIKENLELRGSEQMVAEKQDDGTVLLRRNYVRTDLFYLITAWTRDTQDQHRLLSGALMALYRHATLAEDMLPERLRGLPVPIRLKIAQPDVLTNITDLWSTLDNEIRPGIRLAVTISISPYEPEIVRMVETAEFRFMQAVGSEESSGTLAADLPKELSHTFHIISGKVVSGKYSPALLQMTLLETGNNIPISADGSFKIGTLREGEYHLEVQANGRIVKKHKFLVPSSSYEIEV